jgi:hypothetical protein
MLKTYNGSYNIRASVPVLYNSPSVMHRYLHDFTFSNELVHDTHNLIMIQIFVFVSRKEKIKRLLDRSLKKGSTLPTIILDINYMIYDRLR